MAKNLKVHGRMKVSTLKEEFSKTFGVNIRVYKGRRFADESTTLASIRADGAKGGDIEIHGNTKVSNVEALFKEQMGITIQVEDSAGKLADNDLSLSAVATGSEGGTKPAETKAETAVEGEKPKKGGCMGGLLAVIVCLGVLAWLRMG